MRLLVALLVIFLAAPLQAQPLVMGINNRLSMPFANTFFDGDHYQVNDGYLLRLSELLAKQLNQPIQTQVIRRDDALLLLKTGAIDLLCHMTPEWLSDNSGVLWSIPYATDQEILVSKPNASTVKTRVDLASKSLGVVVGYSYPFLDDIADEVSFSRWVTAHEKANLMQLYGDHSIDYAVIKRSHYSYLASRFEQLKRLGLIAQPLLLGEYSLRCALSEQSVLSLQRLDTVLQQLLAGGDIAALLEHFAMDLAQPIHSAN
jgi:ABC-type amino acid transport substrate-binding protein